MNLSALWNVLSKELADAFRDRRSVVAGLLFALLGPLVLAVALKAMIAAESAEGEAPLLVVGAAHAPGLLAHLAAEGVVPEERSGSPEQLLAQQPKAVVLAVPAKAAADFREFKTARLELWADLSESATRRRAERVQKLVAAYGMEAGRQRLMAQGVMPAVAHPLAIEIRDRASRNAKVALALGMLPVFWILGVFIGGTNVAIDVTGGERERRSLEALLVQPVAPAVLFAGKWLATALFGYATAAAAVLLSVQTLVRLPLHELGIAFAPTWHEQAQFLLLLLPLALTTAALQCALALHAKTHKEAQTYLNLLQLLPMVLVVGQFGNAAAAPALSWFTPVWSHQAAIVTLLRGETLASGHLALSLAGTVLACLALLWFGSRRLGSERFALGL